MAAFLGLAAGAGAGAGAGAARSSKSHSSASAIGSGFGALRAAGLNPEHAEQSSTYMGEFDEQTGGEDSNENKSDTMIEREIQK